MAFDSCIHFIWSNFSFSVVKRLTTFVHHKRRVNRAQIGLSDIVHREINWSNFFRFWKNLKWKMRQLAGAFFNWWRIKIHSQFARTVMGLAIFSFFRLWFFVYLQMNRFSVILLTLLSISCEKQIASRFLAFAVQFFFWCFHSSASSVLNFYALCPSSQRYTCTPYVASNSSLRRCIWI